MAQIGRVYRDSYKKEGKDIPTLVLDIRTVTVRKKFNISVNKLKYPDGKATSVPVQGKEEHPDYHIWYNINGRGESLPAVIVGNIKDDVSKDGLKYKRAKIFDPFLSRHNIYFTLFSVDEAKKIDANHLYNAVAEAYRNMNTANNGYDNNQTAHANYGEPQHDQQQQMHTTDNGREIPIENEEIPF